MKKIFKLVIAILVVEGAGAIGAIFTTPSIDGWYAGLVKPALNPPPWVFGPVWTTLYALMGIALFIVWSKNFQVSRVLASSRKAWNKYSEKFWTGDWQKANILAVFFVQLLLNTFWSIIFFAWHNPGWAFFELIALWIAIVYTMVNFYRVSRTACWLLLPYLLWVSFAGYLNFSLWMLNK